MTDTTAAATCAAQDLMRFPKAGGYQWNAPTPGGNTVYLLPDGETVATVLGWTDHAWRAPYLHGQIELSVTLYGPAAELDLRTLLALSGASWVRALRDDPAWWAGPGYWEGSLAYPGLHELTLVQATPHSCGAEPGRPCSVAPHQPVCTPPMGKPVVFRPNPDPAHGEH